MRSGDENEKIEGRKRGADCGTTDILVRVFLFG